MKLRDIILGSVLIAGITGCVSEPITYGPLAQSKFIFPKGSQGSNITRGPYYGFTLVLSKEEYSNDRTAILVKESSGNPPCYLEVVFEDSASEGTIVRKEGNVEYYPEEVRKLAGLSKK
ncbi:MAG: hypothetical protein US31_C0030G0004 [Berkelbacteria bacterium GW2011_GWA1_36_9]|uniref:Lipoprotein n=1 Tax=Berkelbacteria bacterium GW2011_GWA1_36_9 TaxID=1618331 RepID=A0A0G0FRR1_9BACT|nr:MAG: hypothetical protein US31_C0030G0004 [Berkelbacteria bacterium GW2011_GWA1_36_9]